MKVLALGCLFVLAGLLGSCSDSTPAKAGSFKIAVIPKGTAHEFWKAVEQGARKADDEFTDLTIVWKGPSGEGDAAAQISLVESFIADGVSGICLAPLDARALEKPVRAAVAQKIPVVIFDSGLASADAPIASFVATDNYKGGQMAGEELASALHDEGKVILLRYVLGSESTEQREKGFLDAIAKHPKLEVISSDKHGGPTEADAVAVSETLLSNFGEKLNGAFCSNESATSGFLTAVSRDSRGLGGKVIVIGFDSSMKINQALVSGALRATVVQDPVRMGYLAVVAMHTLLSGGTPEKRIDTGERLLRLADLSSTEVEAARAGLKKK